MSKEILAQEALEGKSKETAALEKLAARYQRFADSAYRRFQISGHRQDRYAYELNEETARGLRIAAAAADDHYAYYHLQAQMSAYANQAEELVHFPDDAKIKKLLKDIAYYGKVKGLVNDKNLEALKHDD